MTETSHKIIGIIPARAGSKRVKNKNLRKLGDRSLIEKTIDVSVASNIFDDVIVSTDSVEIAEHAANAGARVPFLRPAELASDTASTEDVIRHAIGELNLDHNDIVFILQPTSPFREVSDLAEVAKTFNAEDVSGVVSVCECEHSPLWTNTLPDSLRMDNFIRNDFNLIRSQDLPVYYRLNGAIFAYRVGYFKSFGREYSSEIKAYIMPNSRSLDIDTEADFNMALLLNENLSTKSN